jgi:TetR/AcrR family transcriptional regulator, transcriptional repressor for nem operon
MESRDNVTRIERNPEATRKRILEAAFMEIYRKGFQGMRLDDVLAATDLTKGALYHHFPNKRALGYAVVDEVILPIMDEMWLEPLKKAPDPMQGVIDVVEQLPEMKPPEMLEYGCPLNNLAQEMSPLDEGFRQRLDYVFRLWHDVTEEALERAKHQGTLRDSVNCDETATFILAAIEGCIGIAKNAQSIERLRACNCCLVDYLQSLKT